MKALSDFQPDEILKTAQALRWEVGGDFHEQLMEAIYTEPAPVAGRAVPRPDEKPRFDLDRAIDRIVTSRLWGFPLMILLFTLVFWITITGANIPSRWLSILLIDTVYPALRLGAANIGLPWWLSGFGCNAAGMVATRIIDSPRERMIAMLTNNFALCNGRWPTQILIASIFIGALVPPYLAGVISALAVVGMPVW